MYTAVNLQVWPEIRKYSGCNYQWPTKGGFVTGKSWAAFERAELCKALEQYGPAAPTLCGTWTTRDLAAHLVVREHRVDTLPGIMLPGFDRWTSHVQDQAAQRPYQELVDTIRNGPPTLSPFGVPKMDAMLNTSEYFVHHEDIRRAQPGWTVRSLDPREADACWSIVKQRAMGFFRKVPVGVLLVRTDSDRRPHPRVMARKAVPTVKIEGTASELLMFAFGRRDHAKVEITGDQDAINALLHTDMSV